MPQIKSRFSEKINSEIKHLPRQKTGVLVSLKPRKMPCRAKETTTAGAPKALSERNRSAGMRIGEPCSKYDNAG